MDKWYSVQANILFRLYIVHIQAGLEMLSKEVNIKHIEETKWMKAFLIS